MLNGKKTRCCCGPEHRTGNPDPETGSMQPRCVADAHVHARELGRQIKTLVDKETQQRFFRCFSSVVFTLRPGREGSLIVSGTRRCSFEFFKSLAIELSPNPEYCSLNPGCKDGE